MAKKFMFVCVGLLALVGAYSLGARNVEAQSGGEFVGITYSLSGQSMTAITASGDIYAIGSYLERTGEDPRVRWIYDDAEWVFIENILESPVQSDPNALDDLKATFK